MLSELNRLSIPLVLPFCAFLIWTLYTRLSGSGALPKELSWVGRDEKKRFANWRARLSSFKNAPKLLEEGYEKFGKHAKCYIFPDLRTPEIILPRSYTKWLIDQPDSALSTHAAHFETLECHYNFTSPYVVQEPYHERILHRILPRRLGDLTGDVWDEVQNAIDTLWGTDTEEWTDVCIWETMQNVIARVSNRLFVGKPLCRDPHFLHHNAKFATAVGANLILIPLVPKALKPVFGRLLATPNWWHWKQTSKVTMPIITQRLRDMERKAQDPSYDWEEPNDYLSWHIASATAENRPEELDPVLISRRLMALNFAAIHTTSMTFTNLFFDLIASDPSRGYLDGIREETDRVFSESGGVWNKAALQKLLRTDSAVRESMRLNTIITKGLTRKSLVKNGVTVPGQDGFKIPYGAYVGVDGWSVMRDPSIYPNPDLYDAFRFSREREAAAAKEEQLKKREDSPLEGGTAERDMDEVLKMKNLGMITTSDTFLSFGHGKHACPGRFFVSHELKMLLAYITNKYDIQPLESRPENTWYGSTVLPPMKATVRVRRKGAGGEGLNG